MTKIQTSKEIRLGVAGGWKSHVEKVGRVDWWVIDNEHYNKGLRSICESPGPSIRDSKHSAHPEEMNF